MRTRSFIVLAVTIAISLAACKEEDTGHCCVSLNQTENPVPVAENIEEKIPPNLIRLHPSYDCDRLTCVAWQGSEAFCTRECSDDCPEGFDCKTVVESDPGGNSGFTPEDRFCVRKACTGTGQGNCPQEFDCVLVHVGSSSVSDNPGIRHCIKIGHACENN